MRCLHVIIVIVSLARSRYFNHNLPITTQLAEIQSFTNLLYFGV